LSGTTSIEHHAAAHAQSRQAGVDPQAQAQLALRDPRHGPVDHLLSLGQLDRGPIHLQQLHGFMGDQIHHRRQVMPLFGDLGLDADDVEQLLLTGQGKESAARLSSVATFSQGGTWQATVQHSHTQHNTTQHNAKKDESARQNVHCEPLLNRTAGPMLPLACAAKMLELLSRW
jgi:hypothetical protein